MNHSESTLREWEDKMKLEEMNSKIEEILKELTLEEKVKMIHGDALFYSGAVERLSIPAVNMSDGPMGVRQEFPKASWVPVGNSDDFVTYCPSNSAIAATWNKDLAYRAGVVMGQEARGRGKDIILGPGINIKRIPANGRNFEYMSEDPYLISQLVVPLIKGIQESDVAACVKHFALNNQETERLWVNVEIDERALREIYLPGFEAAVKKGGVESLMGAYNLIRGQHCCENKMLLKDILRDEWGYDGTIISDWDAVHDTKAASESPLDIEMSVTYDFDDYKLANPLIEAVKKGEAKESNIDEKVRHILLMMFRLKMIGALAEERKAGCYNTPKHRSEVRGVAEESFVLLKNDDNRLPLSDKGLKELLVIGDNAERLHALGGGSAEIKALYEISPLMGIKSQLGGNTKVTYKRGYYVSPKEESQESWQEKSTDENLDQGAVVNARKQVSDEVRKKRDELRAEAVEAAAHFKDVILVVGLNHDYDVEGFDRDDITLPYEQDRLIEEVLEVNPDTVIVMMAGNAVSMGKWKDKAKTILWQWYCGMEGGNVLADIIFGRVNPSGKLPESMPYRMEDCGAIALGEYPGRPLTDEEKKLMNAHITEEYKDGIYVGYRYYEKYNVPVQYCFGHGLSYTTFEYSDITAVIDEFSVKNSKDKYQDGGEIILDESIKDKMAAKVSLNVKNTGKRFGKEIIEVYVGKSDSRVDRPVKELKGFEKVSLEAGASSHVTVELPIMAFSYYNEAKKNFVAENGKYQIYVGKSLEDIQKVCEVEI